MQLKRRIEEQLLREYIQKLLSEDDTGGAGYGGGAYGMMGGQHGGMNFGGFGAMGKVFTDTWDTIKTAADQVGMSSRMLLNVFKKAAQVIIKDAEADFDSIFQEHDAAMKEYEAKFKDIFGDKNDPKSIAGWITGDVKLAAFLMSPSTYITAAVAKASPGAALGFLETLCGGDNVSVLRNLLHKYGIVEDPAGKEGIKIAKSTGDKKKDKAELKDRMKDLASDSEINKVLSSSAGFTLMRSGITTSMGRIWTRLSEKAKAVRAVQSLDDLARLVPNIDKGLLDDENFKKMPDDEKEKVINQFVENSKASFIGVYVSNMERRIKEAIAQGIPEDSDLIKQYRKAVEQLRNG